MRDGDPHDLRLIAQVHPADWANPAPRERYDLVVVGAGTAGLVTAMGAAGLGARVALVERGPMGGDCLNHGCVPSKALLRAARAAAEVRRAVDFGIRAGAPVIDFPAVMERMRRLRADIARHDSAARFRDAGVDVFLGDARFIGGDAVAVGDARLRYKRAVVATGARPRLPDIPGLAAAGCLTNKTIFDLDELPTTLAILGGGPIGCELAQAFQRLGTRVTLIQRGPALLPREDPEIGAIIRQTLEREGVRCLVDAETIAVEPGPVLRVRTGGREELITADRILAAAGRSPNIAGIGLEDIGVKTDPRRGVLVDDFLRTANRRIFAAGDVCLEQQFTHAADFAARTVIRNALFPFLPKARFGRLVIPHCTYTDPEVAHVGLGTRAAEARGIAIDTHEIPMAGVDRAILDGETGGFARIHTARGTDRILGATLVSAHAGESIGELTLALQRGIGLGALAGVIHPYPTQAEAIRRAGDAYQRTRLTPRAATILRAFIRWTR